MPAAGQTNVAGVILCGGQSRRMGQAKWTMKLAGRPMVDFATAALTKCEPLVISVGHNQTNVPSIESAIVVRDPAPNAGPLQGIREAAHQLADGPQPVDVVTVLSCDVPLVSAATVALLVAHLERGHDDAVVARSDGRVHPTIAAYRFEPLRDICKSGRTNSARLDALVEHLRCRLIDVPPEIALNVNTPADAAQAAQLLAARAL